MAIIKRNDRETGRVPPCRRRLMRILCAALTFMAVLSLPAAAHDPGLSMAGIRVDAQSVAIELTFARRDIERYVVLDQDSNDRVTKAEMSGAQAPLRRLADDLAQLEAGGERLEGTPAKIRLNASDAVIFTRVFSRSGNDGIGYSAPMLPEMPFGHRQFVSVRQHGKPPSTRLLSAANHRITIRLDPLPWWRHSARFVGEGIWHIWIGFDHILFLVAMLLPAALTFVDGAWRPRETWRTTLVQVVKIVTAFTVAHSVTLSLAVFDLVRLDAAWVEPVIAASVIVAALNNVRPLVNGQLWLMSFGFGLIHGLGFAGVLAELGLPAAARGYALIGFNLGVEIGQLAIIAILLPGLFMLRQRRLYRTRILQGASFVIAAIAALWLIERSVGIDSLALLSAI